MTLACTCQKGSQGKSTALAHVPPDDFQGLLSDCDPGWFILRSEALGDRGERLGGEDLASDADRDVPERDVAPPRRHGVLGDTGETRAAGHLHVDHREASRLGGPHNLCHVFGIDLGLIHQQWGAVMNVCDSLSWEVNLHSLTATRGGRGAPRSA